MNPNALGKMVILQATFTRSPRHIHEYVQDAMTYVWAYDHPDLFNIFTCKSMWDEIKEFFLLDNLHRIDMILLHAWYKSEGKYTKQYPRDLLAKTIYTGNDRYPYYRRRSSEDSGKTITLKE